MSKILINLKTVLLSSLIGYCSFGGANTIGLNKFDLVNQYLANASGGDGSVRYLSITSKMADKSLLDASDAGVRYIRTAASGYAPAYSGQLSDLDLWIRSPATYWQRLDSMFEKLDQSGIKIIPTFVWNLTQYPVMSNETVREFVTNPKSLSYLTAERYVREFISRYKARKTVLFYELTNEMNLGADLDTLSRCNRDGAPAAAAVLCKPKGNYTTDEMIAFTKRLAMVVREADNSRLISSGFSVPRPSAEHLRAKPEWIAGKADFTPDSVEQFQKNLADIHAAVDIISVHLYPGAGNARFGDRDQNGTALLDQVVAASAKAGKPLFVGEFGDAERLDARPDSFTVRMINRIAELKVPYSAIWAWQFYQRSPYQTRENKDTAYSLEPGFTDDLIRKIAQTNAKLGNPPPVRAPNDTTPPRLVLTWPLACTQARSLQGAHAVASDDSGGVAGVNFYLGDTLLAELTKPPYSAVINSQKFPAGEYVLKAQARDAAGNVAESATTLVIGKPVAASCLQVFP